MSPLGFLIFHVRCQFYYCQNYFVFSLFLNCNLIKILFYYVSPFLSHVVNFLHTSECNIFVLKIPSKTNMNPFCRIPWLVAPQAITITLHPTPHHILPLANISCTYLHFLIVQKREKWKLDIKILFWYLLLLSGPNLQRDTVSNVKFSGKIIKICSPVSNKKKLVGFVT